MSNIHFVRIEFVHILFVIIIIDTIAASECDADARAVHFGLNRNLMLEFLLKITIHDQQCSMAVWHVQDDAIGNSVSNAKGSRCAKTNAHHGLSRANLLVRMRCNIIMAIFVAINQQAVKFKVEHTASTREHVF